MTDQLLIRNVSPELKTWVEEQRKAAVMGQNEFLLDILRKESARGSQLALFAATPKVERVPNAMPFAFIDLFAGIGGLRLGLERVGGECVYSCEWDRYAQKTYRAWFGETPAGDIREVKPADIPNHDVLAAGFPCQPFSIAGVSKKKSLGRAHGFKDKTQGNLFFNLATIIEVKRPPVLLLENVKNLLSHDGGRTWKVISQTLDNLEYKVFPNVVDAAPWVPQHRERIFIVGFDRHTFGDHPPFRLQDAPTTAPVLKDILDIAPSDKYTLSMHLWTYLQKYAEKHREKGNGFGFGLADPKGVTRTLSARYFKDGSEILIARGKNQSPRRLTPDECARLMGFNGDLARWRFGKNKFEIVVSDTQAYRQFGNAVVPSVVEWVARSIIDVMVWQFRRRGGLLKGEANAAQA